MAENQFWDPERYARNARFVSELGGPVVQLLEPQSGERILDLGCGDGHLTVKLAALGAKVKGIDTSPEQIAAAVDHGVEAEVGDGTALSYDREFDAVFSNGALHWMQPPEAVVDSVWRALKPGGRFVGEFGARGNISAVHVALHAVLRHHGVDPVEIDPWYFPTADEYRQLLENRGFEVLSLATIPRPTPLPGSLRDWLATLAGVFLQAVPDVERESLSVEIEELLRPVLVTQDGSWVVDYTRLRFAARKPM